MKQLAPYGKFLKELISSGKFPTNDVYLFIGDYSWPKAKNFQNLRSGTLCLPPRHHPSQYEWPVMGCDILIGDTSESLPEYIEDIAYELFSYGANIVRYVSKEGLLTIYKKDL